MEDLTKQQIVLVTLLVSFVTSIATGIVTVALMDQAPPGVTQTINRVVERTIEKVVPSQNQTASVVTKETVVVKEDDLVVSAVEKNVKSLVSIVATLGTSENYREVFLGNGLVVNKDGLIATDFSIAEPKLDDNKNVIPETYSAEFSDGKSFPLKIVSSDPTSGVAYFKVSLDEKNKSTTFSPATIADPKSVKLGQTIIALGGEKISVATGIISNLAIDNATAQDMATSTDALIVPKNAVIKTDISTPSKSLGGILVNLSGAVVGIRLNVAGVSDNAFLPINAIPTELGKN